MLGSTGPGHRGGWKRAMDAPTRALWRDGYPKAKRKKSYYGWQAIHRVQQLTLGHPLWIIASEVK
jgi:hypothetical protein